MRKKVLGNRFTKEKFIFILSKNYPIIFLRETYNATNFLCPSIQNIFLNLVIVLAWNIFLTSISEFAIIVDLFMLFSAFGQILFCASGRD